MYGSQKALALLSPVDFKKLLVASPDLSDEERGMINRSSISCLHIYFGVVPDNVTISLFAKIARFEELDLNETQVFPLYPLVQSSWDGNQLADWLISAKIVKESKRAGITANLTGAHFLEGFVLDKLDWEDLHHMHELLYAKVRNIANYAWKLIGDLDVLKYVICSLLNVKAEDLTSEDNLQRLLRKKYTIDTQILKPFKAIVYASKYVKLAFNQEYLDKESITRSFVDHIKAILKGNKYKYFASYIFLGQSSCMGTSRLLGESWEDSNTALFIIRINCGKRGCTPKCAYTNDHTGRLVERILLARTQEQLAPIFRALLHLVLEKALDTSNYLRDTEHLSLSVDDLGITFDEVLGKMCDRTVLGSSGLDAICNRISGMALKRPGSIEKKVIPIIAFDEAAVLIENQFTIREVVDPYFRGIIPKVEEINTFKLIRSVLHNDLRGLWNCPFIFAGTNIKFFSLFPPHHPLFEPYILTLPLNAFAFIGNTPISEIQDWKNYIRSSAYVKQLSNFGRPLWGAILNANQQETESAVLDNIVDIASIKLSYSPPTGTKGDFVATMALTGILTAADWSLGKNAADLVERGMAILVGYKKETYGVFICYPPEPVLAYAALSVLHTHPAQILEDLEKMKMEASVFSRPLGNIGKFAAKILFLLCIPNPDFKQPFCSVRDLFINLLGEENFKKLQAMQSAQCLLQGNFCFSYFATFEDICKKPHENFSVLASLNAALVMPKYITEIDLIIPVVLDDGKFGSINIQVHSTKSHYMVNEIQEKKHSTMYCAPDIPRMNIIMNVSPSAENKCTVKEDEGITTIFLEGLDTCFGATFARLKRLAELEGRMNTTGNMSMEKSLYTLLSSGWQRKNIEDAMQLIPYKDNMQVAYAQLNNMTVQKSKLSLPGASESRRGQKEPPEKRTMILRGDKVKTESLERPPVVEPPTKKDMQLSSQVPTTKGPTSKKGRMGNDTRASERSTKRARGKREVEL